MLLVSHINKHSFMSRVSKNMISLKKCSPSSCATCDGNGYTRSTLNSWPTSKKRISRVPRWKQKPSSMAIDSCFCGTMKEDGKLTCTDYMVTAFLHCKNYYWKLSLTSPFQSSYLQYWKVMVCIGGPWLAIGQWIANFGCVNG